MFNSGNIAEILFYRVVIMEKRFLITEGQLQIPCILSAPDNAPIHRVVLGVHGFGGSANDAIQTGLAEEMELFYAAMVRFEFKDLLPHTIELGRSFVSLEYQSTRMGSKSLYALDNLWDGLGALAVVLPEVKYYFGKVTMYPSYDKYARDLILYFLKKHFADTNRLVEAIEPLQLVTDEEKLKSVLVGTTFKEDYRILKSEVHNVGLSIPPLVNAYMSLSPSMKVFGTAINKGFGDVEETGIFITVDEIVEEKYNRYIGSFAKSLQEKN